MDKMQWGSVDFEPYSTREDGKGQNHGERVFENGRVRQAGAVPRQLLGTRADHLTKGRLIVP